MPHSALLDSSDPASYTLRTSAEGPTGKLPRTAQMLPNATSGYVFGMIQSAGMGWNPRKLLGKEFLILSTQDGIRAADSTPLALGYHTGQWKVGLLMEKAARTFYAPRFSLILPPSPASARLLLNDRHRRSPARQLHTALRRGGPHHNRAYRHAH